MFSSRSSSSSESQRRAFLDEKDFETLIQSHHRSQRTKRTTSIYVGAGLSLLLVISLAANVFFLFANPRTADAAICTTSATSSVTKHEHSKYADLIADVSFPFEWATGYGSPDMDVAGPLWDSISFDVGMVALDYNWTDAQGLPRAQKFPWDHDKGIYVLNGFHNLHCLKSIHLSMREYMQNKTQTHGLMHIMHCMDSLRQDVLCHADDTPRYTTITKSPESAVGQFHQCRDWTKLVEWAKERSACYHYISAEADFINQFERFKYCPRDSPYWDSVRKHFKKPDDWYPTKDEIAGPRKGGLNVGTYGHS